MTLRASHGAAKERGLPGPRVEVLPADELPALNAAQTDQGRALARERGRPFQKGNTCGGRLPALVVLGVKVEGMTDQAYQNAMRKAASYRRVRCAELARDHGGRVSAVVAATVASAAAALAVSRYLYELAGRTADVDVQLKIIQRANASADSARQNELAAMELAARDAKARPGDGALDLDKLTAGAEERAQRRRRGEVVTTAGEEA